MKIYMKMLLSEVSSGKYLSLSCSHRDAPSLKGSRRQDFLLLEVNRVSRGAGSLNRGVHADPEPGWVWARAGPAGRSQPRCPAGSLSEAQLTTCLHVGVRWLRRGRSLGSAISGW